MTDDPIPERKGEQDDDTPEYTFGEDSISLATTPLRYKEDYRRTQRDGQNVYALIADPNQFVTPDSYKALTSRKEVEVSTNSASFNAQDSKEPQKPHWFKEAKTLSIKEAEELFEPLIAALQSGFEYLDKGIWLYCMSSDQQPIWSDMSDKEVNILAGILIKRGQRNAETAAAIRVLVDSDLYIQVAAMTIPRGLATVRALKSSPRPELRRAQRAARRGARGAR